MKRFALPDGSPFARLFDTGLGQVLATLTVNADGNPVLTLSRWAGGDVVEVSVGVRGVRTGASDKPFVEGFHSLTAERVEAAWREALKP